MHLDWTTINDALRTAAALASAVLAGVKFDQDRRRDRHQPPEKD